MHTNAKGIYKSIWKDMCPDLCVDLGIDMCTGTSKHVMVTRADMDIDVYVNWFIGTCAIMCTYRCTCV